MNKSESVWTDTIKPLVMIGASVATWVVSMVFFVVGFSFGSQMMFGNFNVGFPVSITIGLILTAIELAWNEEKEDVLDWGIWLFAYGLGIASNYYGLTIVLGMSDPNVEKIIAGLLGTLIEIAPERMLIRGLRNININLPTLIRSIGKGKGPKNSKGYTPTYRPSEQFAPTNNKGQNQQNFPRSEPKPQNMQGRPPQNGQPMFHMLNEEDLKKIAQAKKSGGRF